jgi:hypothetical protein
MAWIKSVVNESFGSFNHIIVIVINIAVVAFKDYILIKCFVTET